MNVIAALDVGTEKTVMAIAEDTGSEVLRMSGMKMIASQGVENGIIRDKARFKSYMQYLLRELDPQRKAVVLNVLLPYQVLQISEHKVNVPLQRRQVRENDIVKAEIKCRQMVAARPGELIDVLPVAYYIDRENYTTRPIGQSGGSIDVRFRVYKADGQYVSEIRHIICECGMEEVNFFPPVRAYMEAMDVAEKKGHFALVDMGASHIGVLLFKNGLPVKEAVLPLGTRTLDKDIAAAFKLEDVQLAKKLKHTKGSAIRTMCKNEKIQIAEANKQIDKKDLSQVIQCRLEELLEGVVYQLQQWEYTDPEGTIYLTGDGSKITDTDTLLMKLSGQEVCIPRALNVMTTNEALLEAPACLAVIGLLACEHHEPEEEKGSFGRWLSGIFK